MGTVYLGGAAYNAPADPRAGGAAGPAGSSLSAIILAEAALQHFWKLNDIAGSASCADSKGSQPLTVHGSPLLGAPGILNTTQGETGMIVDPNHSGYLTCPAGVLSSSTTWSIEFVYQAPIFTPGGTTGPLFVSGSTTLDNLLFAAVGAAAGMEIVVGGQGTYNSGMPIPLGAPIHVWLFVQSGVAVGVYINGYLLISVAPPVLALSVNGLALGAAAFDAGGPQNGQYQYLAVYNAIPNAAQVLAHYAACNRFR